MRRWWPWGLKGEQNRVMDYDVPELWRRRVLTYLIPEFVIIILLEMLLVGRWLWLPLALIGLILSRTWVELAIWWLIAATLALLAATGAWWPVYWMLRVGEAPYWFIRFSTAGQWIPLPGLLAALRILLAGIVPAGWLAATVLGTVRGSLEIILPEVSNTPLMPVNLLELLAHLRTQEGVAEEDQAPEIVATRVYDVPGSQPVREIANGVSAGGSTDRTAALLPTHLFAGSTSEEKLASQAAFARYVLQDEANYSRNRTRRYFQSDTAARAFFEHMRRYHLARLVNSREQRLTATGIYVLGRVADVEALTD